MHGYCIGNHGINLGVCMLRVKSHLLMHRVPLHHRVPMKYSENRMLSARDKLTDCHSLCGCIRNKHRNLELTNTQLHLGQIPH